MSSRLMPRLMTDLRSHGNHLSGGEHYGTLREWAKELGEKDAHDLLSEILDQEKAANHTLTHIAVTELNSGSHTGGSQQRSKPATAAA